MEIFAGTLSTACIVQGKLWVCGYNELGQLAVGNFATPILLSQISLQVPISKIAIKSLHTAAMTTSGLLMVCGNNENGQLGLGNNNPINKFVFPQLPFSAKLSDVVVGKNHTLVVTENNELFGCGDNEYSQLGVGRSYDYSFCLPLVRRKIGYNVFHRATPAWLSPHDKIVSLAAGNFYTVFVTSSGVVGVCGDNKYGQLGLNHKKTQHSFQRVALRLNPEEKVIAVRAGADHTILLTNQGNIYGCGKNEQGQLGLAQQDTLEYFKKINFDKKVDDVKVGAEHTVILSEGKLFGCGENTEYQLIQDNTLRSIDQLRLIFTPEPSSKIESFAAGSEHTIAFIRTASNNLVFAGFGRNTCKEIPEAFNVAVTV